MYRNDKLLKKLRNVPCAVCNRQDGTIVAAHRNEGKGMGIKVSDALVAALCYQCHYSLDQGNTMDREEKRQFWNGAYIKTIKYMIENEMLVVK